MSLAVVPSEPIDVDAFQEAAVEATAHSGRVRDFVLFSAAQCLSSVGSWMQKTAFGWLVWELTRSPAWVGAIGIADLIALLWVAPLAGPLTDRANPFRLLMVTQTGLLILSAALGVSIATGGVSIWALGLFTLADATLQGFNQPARMMATGLLAGPERISQAVATNSIGMNLARSVGPMIAGAIIAAWGAAPVMALDALSFTAMLAGILWFRPILDRPGERVAGSLRNAVAGSFATVARDRRTLPVLILAAGFSLLARPFFEMLPAFAGLFFGGDPRALASLLSAQGLGALAGALLMLRRRSERMLARIAILAGVVLSAVVVMVAVTRDLALALPLMLAAGLGHVICNIAMQSLLQLRAPYGARGQALSLYSLLFRAGPSLGALVIGFASAAWGLSIVLVVSAAMAGLVMLAAGRRV